MSSPPVRALDLTRRFGSRVALRDARLEVDRGEVVGLVGPNGSGKTTLLRMLSGFLKPTSGTVEVFGEQPYGRQARIMERARFAFAPPPLFETLSAREHLEYLASIRTGAMPRVTSAEIDEALRTVGLFGRQHDRVRAFSFGMRQRLVLAQALLPLPELIVLDEPTDGLDPLAILELRELIRRLSERGVSVLLSSHLLVEIEELVDRMLVLAEGETVFYGAPSELVRGLERLRIEVGDIPAARSALEAAGHSATQPSEGELELAANALSLGECHELLRRSENELRGYRTSVPTLEQALLLRLREHSERKGSQ